MNKGMILSQFCSIQIYYLFVFHSFYLNAHHTNYALTIILLRWTSISGCLAILLVIAYYIC